MTFKNNFRLSRATFAYQCSKLAPLLQKEHYIREPLSVELQVAVTLGRPWTNAENKSIGHILALD